MKPSPTVSPIHEGRWRDDCNVGNSMFTNEEQDIEDREHGLVIPKSLPDPGAPSRQEILEHELTHVPFRSWCPHCVAGRAKSMKHALEKWSEETKIPVIGSDYCFMNKTDEDFMDISSLKIMVAKDRRSKCVFALPVPAKGIDDEEFGTRQLIKSLDFLGYSSLILKSDQEASIVNVFEHVRDHRGEDRVQIGIEHSPKYDPQAYGMVERAVQSIEGQVRTMVLALENKLGAKLNADYNIIPWLVSYAGILINRFQVGPDNKTNHERLRGRKSKRELVEFGECVWWLPLDYKNLPKMDAKLYDGLFLGVKEDTDEVLIGTESGVFLSRTICEFRRDSFEP